MSKELQIKKIAEKLKSVENIDITRVRLQKEDIEVLANNQVLRVVHPKGFNIMIRKEFRVELMLGIPTLMYSIDKYIVSDEYIGQHGISYAAEDMAEYVNGLIGIHDEE